MAQVSVDAQTCPLLNFKFLIKQGNTLLAGVSKVSGFTRSTEVVKHRSGGDPSTSHKCPGRTEYEPITLERGVTYDVEFEKWANQVWNFRAGLGSEVSLANFRRDITIEILNQAGQIQERLIAYRCWVSKWTPVQGLDANANAVLIEQITLENEGWERDTALVRPTEPIF